MCSPGVASGMPESADVVEFHRSDPSVLSPRFDAIDREGGGGWINIGPALRGEDWDVVPQRSGLAAWFSGRGPAVPMATWTPESRGEKAVPAQIGISHGTGPNAMDRLEAKGVVLPPGWTKKQDHAKHGIVAELPPGADPAVVVGWLIDAMAILSALVDTDDYWIAEVHKPR